MVTDLGTTNVWLAVMAFAAVLQTAMMFVVALVALRLLRRMEDSFARIEYAIEPVASRVSAVLDDIHGLSEAGRRADQSVRATVNQISSRVHRARGLVLGRFQPVFRAVRVANATLSAVRARRSRAAANDDDRRAIEDFVAEGAPAQAVQ
jgi:hypothetical protein